MPNRVLHLTDLVDILKKLGKKVVAVPCDDWQEYRASMEMYPRISTRHQKYMQERSNTGVDEEGCYNHDPNTTYIGPNV